MAINGKARSFEGFFGGSFVTRRLVAKKPPLPLAAAPAAILLGNLPFLWQQPRLLIFSLRCQRSALFSKLPWRHLRRFSGAGGRFFLKALPMIQNRELFPEIALQITDIAQSPSARAGIVLPAACTASGTSLRGPGARMTSRLFCRW